MSGRSRREEDDGCAHEADRDAGHIPSVGPDAFGQPQPAKRGGDVDAAIGRIGPPGRAAFSEGQKPREEDEREDAGNEPERRLVQPPPRPEREATGDLGQRRGNEYGYGHRGFPNRWLPAPMSGKAAIRANGSRGPDIKRPGQAFFSTFRLFGAAFLASAFFGASGSGA